MSLAADIMCDVGRVGAAKRRRDRQLHSHRQLFVSVECSARPKSKVVEGPSEGEVHETYDALRRLKAPLPGMRPSLPPEPEPMGRAVTDGYVAAPVPLLVVASLAGGDVGRWRRRVLEENAKAKAAEKEEAKMLKLSERIRSLSPSGRGTVGKPLRLLLGRGRGGGRRRLLEPLPISRFAALIVDNCSGMSMAGFAVLVLLTLYSLRLSAGLSC